MPKSDNVFRFVSIRAPRVATTPNRSNKHEPEESDKLVRELDLRGQGGHETRSHVRRALGDELIASEDYYAKDPVWQRLLPHWPQLEALVAEKPDREIFRTRASKILSTGLGADVNLDDFVADEQFRSLRRKLWRGYYANVLSPERMPEHREETTNWLKLFDLLEVSRNADDYPVALAEWRRVRVAVPRAFLESDAEVRRPTEEEPDNDEQLVVRKRTLAEIDRLERVRKTLKRLSADKLARQIAARAAPPTSTAISQELTQLKSAVSTLQWKFDRLCTAAPPAVGKEQIAQPGEPTAPAGSETSVEPNSDPPWHLRRDEVCDEHETLAVLDALELNPDLLPVPDLVYAIDQRIALLHADLEVGESTLQVIGFGRSARRVYRAIMPNKAKGG